MSYFELFFGYFIIKHKNSAIQETIIFRKYYYKTACVSEYIAKYKKSLRK